MKFQIFLLENFMKATASNPIRWKQNVYQQLRQRNEQQTYIFEEIYHSNSTKLEEILKLNITLFDLKSHLNSIQVTQ